MTDVATSLNQLSNLLARIHRDGGHYEHEHGTAKAVEDADKIIADLYGQVEELRCALEQSLKLQSHYAALLNMYDGGTRMQFKTVEAWMKRLYEELLEPCVVCGALTIARVRGKPVCSEYCLGG